MAGGRRVRGHCTRREEEENSRWVDRGLLKIVDFRCPKSSEGFCIHPALHGARSKRIPRYLFGGEVRGNATPCFERPRTSCRAGHRGSIPSTRGWALVTRWKLWKQIKAVTEPKVGSVHNSGPGSPQDYRIIDGLFLEGGRGRTSVLVSPDGVVPLRSLGIVLLLYLSIINYI
ncbi:unnamed protein product [Nezara viridula]|uniref:Uncharacterized protein n=1 Tax=Nezara viridula TaxID=85310 RepID=A0A9P0H8N4_NEZVI|nr:unnamed protein product [Nezara viridula]